MQSMRNVFTTHFVVKVIQLYLGPESQQIIILLGLSFYTCSCYGKIRNRNTHSQEQSSQVS